MTHYFHVSPRVALTTVHTKTRRRDVTMRTVTAAAAVALAATTSTSEASSSVSVPISIPLNSLETRGGASFPDNDKTPRKAPRRANKKKKKSTKNPSKGSEIPNNTEKEAQEPIAQEEDGPSEPPKPTSPSPQETLIEELSEMRRLLFHFRRIKDRDCYSDSKSISKTSGTNSS